MSDYTRIAELVALHGFHSAKAEQHHDKASEALKKAQEACDHPASKTSSKQREDDYGKPIGSVETHTCLICGFQREEVV